MAEAAGIAVAEMSSIEGEAETCKKNLILNQKNEYQGLTPITLPSGGIPRMEVLGLSESLLTLSIIRLMVKITSRGTVAGTRTLKGQLTFGS